MPLDTPHHLMLEQDAAWARWTDEVREFLGTMLIAPNDPQFAALTRRERDLVE